MDQAFDVERALKGKQNGGRLEQWHKQVFEDGGYIIWGNCFDDQCGRFYDGQRIHTSLVIKHHKEDRIIETLNSYYILGKPEGVDLTKKTRLSDKDIGLMSSFIS